MNKDYLNELLPYLLARADQLVSREYYLLFKKSGAKIWHWRALSVLLVEGDLSVTELAERILSEQPTATRLVDSMEKEGLVTRNLASDDKRKVLVRITSKGRQVANSLKRISDQYEVDLAKTVDEEDLKILRAALRKLIARLASRDVQDAAAE